MNLCCHCYGLGRRREKIRIKVWLNKETERHLHNARTPKSVLSAIKGIWKQTPPPRGGKPGNTLVFSSTVNCDWVRGGSLENQYLEGLSHNGVCSELKPPVRSNKPQGTYAFILKFYLFGHTCGI